jgi:hypothetical protein
MSLIQVTSRARLGLTFGILVAALVLGFLTVQTGFADEQPKTETPAPKLSPELDVVPRDAIGFITIRVADLWTSEIGTGLRQRVSKHKSEELEKLANFGLTMPEIERFTAILHNNPSQVLMVVTTSKPYSLPKILSLIGPEPEVKKDQEKNYHENINGALYALSDRIFVLGSPEELRTLVKSAGRKVKGSLPEPWLVANEKHHVMIGINPGKAAKVVGMPLPPALQPLLQSQSAALAVDFGVELSALTRMSFANANQAKEGEKAINAGSDWLQGILTNYLDKELEPEREEEAPNFAKLLRELAISLRTIAPKSQATSVEASLRMKLGPATAGGLLAELSQFNEGTSVGGMVAVNGQETQDPTREHLKQLAEALLNYGLDHGHLPANAIYSKKGEPLLSWRVELLPYLEQEELYKRFKLDEPWDSEHNLKLIKDMPEVFNDRWSSQAGKYKATRFRVFSGRGTAFEGTKGVRLDNFPDGISTTFLIVQAYMPAVWTKPDVFPYLPNRRLCGLGGHTHEKGFYAAFADGSVRFFKQETDEKTIRALITRNGGEKVRLPDER